jgi:hypothetical protein
VADVDRLSLLILARDTIVSALSESMTCPSCDAVLDVPGNGLPALVRELRAVLAEIEAMPGSGEVSELDGLADGITDDLAARRARREAAG